MTTTVRPMPTRKQRYTHEITPERRYYAISYSFGPKDVMDGRLLGGVWLFEREEDRTAWIAANDGVGILSVKEPVARRTIEAAHHTDDAIRFVDATGAEWDVRAIGQRPEALELARCR